MAQALAAKSVRTTLGVVFTVLLVVNVVILTMAARAAADGAALLPPHLGPEVAVGVRLLLFVAGAAAAWLFARFLFQTLVKREVSSLEATGPALSLMAYVVIFVTAYAFLGFGTWLWLPLLFTIVFFWSLVSVWSLVGAAAMVVSLLGAVAAGVLTWMIWA